MGVSKLAINGVVRFDLTADTVEATNLLSGYSAHGSDGEAVSGTLEETIPLTAAQILAAVQVGWV